MKRITVCASCLRASCWSGILYCEDARTASTRTMTIDELTNLGREHSSYWRSK